MVHGSEMTNEHHSAIASTPYRLTCYQARAVVLVSLTAFLNLMTAGLASPANPDPTTLQDRTFVRMADQAQVGDLRFAALALHKSADRRVTSFATRVRDVDFQLRLELRSIAAAQHVSLPTTLGRRYESQLRRLQLEHGSAFDIDYLTSQLRADQRVLSIYQREAASGVDFYIIAFAKETIPVLDQHIWLARRGLATLTKRARPAPPVAARTADRG